MTVTEIGHGKCRLGISADREIPIFRSELLEDRKGDINDHGSNG